VGPRIAAPGPARLGLAPSPNGAVRGETLLEVSRSASAGAEIPPRTPTYRHRPGGGREASWTRSQLAAGAAGPSGRNSGGSQREDRGRRFQDSFPGRRQAPVRNRRSRKPIRARKGYRRWRPHEAAIQIGPLAEPACSSPALPDSLRDVSGPKVPGGAAGESAIQAKLAEGGAARNPAYRPGRELPVKPRGGGRRGLPRGPAAGPRFLEADRAERTPARCVFRAQARG